jgi:spore maturation protein CgeB
MHSLKRFRQRIHHRAAKLWGLRQGLHISYLCDPNPYARGLIRLKALRALGHDVQLIPTVPRVTDYSRYRQPDLWERVVRKFGVFPDVTDAGKALLTHARSSPVDLIWIDKGQSVQGSLLKAAKDASGALAVSFSEDDMALPHNQSRRWLQALPVYDLVVTTKIANIEARELEALGAQRVLYVTQSFDAEQHFPVPMTPDEQADFQSDVSFIGWFEKERARSIEALAQAGLPVRVWGPGWDTTPKHPNVTIEARTILNTDKKLDYSKALTASKISLGFLRKLNRDQHTSRTLEIPACGSMLLAERTPVHQAMFHEGVEAEFFDSDAELVAKAGYYLEHESARRALAEAGRKRCLRDYSSVQQMNRILDALGVLAG